MSLAAALAGHLARAREAVENSSAGGLGGKQVTGLDPGKILSDILADILRSATSKPAVATPPAAAKAPLTEATVDGRITEVSTDAAGKAGTAWVRGGRIFVRNPENGGAPAVLVPSSGLRVFLNGVPIVGPTEVWEQDVIEYEPRVDFVPPRLEVVISPDDLLASIDIAFGRRIEHVLDDQEPASRLVLRTRPVSRCTQEPTFDQIVNLLAQEGITYGIDTEKLKRILQEQQEGQFVIARGTPPQPPEDETVEILFKTGTYLFPREDRYGKVDFREYQRIPTVEKGTLLARKIPGKPGTPGVGVRGETIEPPPPQPVRLVCGPGTALTDNGTAVVATIGGQPTCDIYGRTYVFGVNQLYIIDRDVDVRTGNVRFRGNIEVRGSIKPGMIVHATGNLTILGDVDTARVGAYGRVNIAGSVVNSRVIAGCSEGAAFTDMAEDLEQVCDQIAFLLNTLERIHADPRFSCLGISFGQLLQYLVDLHFRNLPAAVTDLLTRLYDIIAVLPEDTQFKLADLGYYFRGINLMRLENIEQLRLLYRELLFIAGCVRHENSMRADLVLAYALNSKLAASGNVVVTGQGCYNTDVDAGGDVKVWGTVRGGYISSNKGAVVLGEAGSEIGIKTSVRVSAGQHVYIGRVHPGVRIFVGRQRILVSEPASYVHVHFDSRGRLQFSHLPVMT